MGQYVRGIKKQVEGDNVQGLKAYFKGAAARFAAAIGRVDELAAILKEDPSDVSALARYERELKSVANNLIFELLGEGSRNISDIDRRLAEEIVGLFRGMDLITIDKEVLLDRLSATERNISGKIERGWNEIQGIENFWNSSAHMSGQPVMEDFLRQRQSIMGEPVEFTVTGSEDAPLPEGVTITYNWEDIYNPETNTINL